MPAEALYVGLMSGTSLDGIDAVIADLGHTNPRLVNQLHRPYPGALRDQLSDLCQAGGNEIDRLGGLDIQVAEAFADATLELLGQTQVDASAIKAIGSHGQTLRHRPGHPHPFTLQIGDPSRIAERTGITTVADFRRRDMAVGGQGAPLVPAFHAAIFRDRQLNRVILNIGGIANITWLPTGDTATILGFDTGPGNTLLDHWNRCHQSTDYDQDGSWAATGRALPKLLDQLLNDPYFHLLPPKSTGVEYFSPDWLKTCLPRQDHDPADIQATLAELTARSVAQAVHEHCERAEQLLVCGGGVHNQDLLRRLAIHLPEVEISSTARHGVDPDWVEAMTFAWLAKRTLEGLPGNLPSVTGADRPVVLGGIYPSVDSTG